MIFLFPTKITTKCLKIQIFANKMNASNTLSNTELPCENDKPLRVWDHKYLRLLHEAISALSSISLGSFSAPNEP